MAIESNSDLPAVLNTEEKQVRIAKKLAAELRGAKAKTGRCPKPQGFFSRTVIVTLASGEEIVIQFRPEVLDLDCFLTARDALPDFVPEVGQIADETLSTYGINVYWMTRIPGQTWFHGVRGKDTQSLITINKSLGKILGRGWLPNQSTSVVVDRRLRPHLDFLISSADSRIQPFQAVAREFRAVLEDIKTLPLFVSHFDLNEMNIMIDDSCEVTGLIDWEMSTPLPFGMGFGRIHTLAGEYFQRKFHMPKNFEEAERGFWEAAYSSLAKEVRHVVEERWGLVETSVRLGTLLGTFELENGSLIGVNAVALEALPKFLTYRIPFTRGSDPPYAK